MRNPKLTKRQIRQALKKNGKNVSAAARKLGVTRATIYNTLKRKGG